MHPKMLVWTGPDFLFMVGNWSMHGPVQDQSRTGPDCKRPVFCSLVAVASILGN